MKGITAVLIGALLLTACQQVFKSKRNKGLETLDWMSGNWQMQTPEGLLTEQWEAVNDTLWKGYSVMKDDSGAVLFEEQIELKKTDSGIYYLPSISNQNGGEPVLFKATAVSDDEAVFENPEHDFPQRITYKKNSDTSMTAAIEGSAGGDEKREEFAFVRSK